MEKSYKSDVVIIGGGLAGISTAHELLEKNLKVLIIDRDKPEFFGGLAKDSFGGIMIVDTPHQRRLGIKDTPELALSDWHSYAQFGVSDTLPRQWAQFYCENSLPYIFEWLDQKSIKFLPIVNWPERGLYRPGNSVPRWHITWGTGFAIIEGLLQSLNSLANRKNLTILYQHQVNGLISADGKVTGCSGIVEDTKEEFICYSDQVVISCGGYCGGDLSKVKSNWYKPWGKAPENLLNGSHQYADGKLHDVVDTLGGNITHLDKQWHYAAGIPHPNPTKKNHGLSIVPPRSALWMNANGKRIGPNPLVSYTDTRHLVESICKEPGQYSWQILNWKIAIKELGVSGGDYMRAFREKNKLRLVKDILFGNKELINRLLQESDDFITANSVKELADKMNRLTGDNQVDSDLLTREIQNYDGMIDQGEKYFNDQQLRWIANFRNYKGDRLRTCKFQKINDPAAMPLMAIREFILTRKSLGGIQTNLQCQVMDKKGTPITGLYAVGESAGFGGGGIHGLGSLEGTFLGSCVITGRVAAKVINGENL